MSTVARWAERVAQLPIYLACAALFALMIMTFADVILRSALNAPIEAATELTRMLMAIVVFSVLPVLSVRSGHIVVDLMDTFYRGGIVSRIRDGLISLACGALLILPAGRVVVLAERARSYGDLTEYLNIPQFYIGWFIAIMTYITAGVLLLRGLMILFAPKTVDYHDV